MFSIPEEKLPQCFKDDLRLNVLYAPLRSKSVNPSDWNSKIVSWNQLINLYCSCNNVYSFSLESLRKSLHHNGRTPSCLKEVLQEMVKTGDVEELDIFLQERPKTWKEWVTHKFISSPISWSLNKMKGLVTDLDNNTIYIPVKVLEQEGDLILSKISVKYKNKLISMKDFLEMENADIRKAQDYKFLFTSLHNRRRVHIMELPHQDMTELSNFLIKFSGDNELVPITEVDLAIYNLEKNEKVLERNIETLEDNITDCIKEAKLHLKKGHRQLAKAGLRKKNEVEKRIDRKIAALHNVQILLQKLQDSKMDNNIWESYKKSLEAFESAYKKGINEDAVEDTMLKLGEMLEINSEIQSALARPMTDEDADLEEELAQLLKDDNNEDNSHTDDQIAENISNLDINLPDVPNSPVANMSEDNISTQLS